MYEIDSLSLSALLLTRDGAAEEVCSTLSRWRLGQPITDSTGSPAAIGVRKKTTQIAVFIVSNIDFRPTAVLTFSEQGQGNAVVLAPHESFGSVNRIQDPHSIRGAVKCSCEVSTGQAIGQILFSTISHNACLLSSVQYSTEQYSTVQCSTVQYSTVQYSTVRAV